MRRQWLCGGGGTIAYLQGETGDVVNEFKTNKVLVELNETGTDENGVNNSYNIIPGTEQSKDPKVTVDNTVDAYVFVEVTDKTDGLIRYEIAGGWIALTGYEDKNPKVYYREVAGDAAVKVFDILEENKVIYDAALENSDMLKNNKLKSGIALSFKASAVQKAAFADAAAAYAVKSNGSDVRAALENGNSVILGTDILGVNTAEESNFYVYQSKSKPRIEATIDLNSKTVAAAEGTDADKSGVEYVIKAALNVTLTVDGNGTVIGGSGAPANKINAAVEASNGAKVIINSGTFTTGPDASGGPNPVVYVRRTNTKQSGAEVEINGGFFYNSTCDENGNYWLLNIEDDDVGVCKIIVKGGTFVNFDPADNMSDGEHTNYVADGYKSVAEKQANGDIYYTVVPIVSE